MSQTDVFVKAQNGQFYRCPKIVGANWFVRFDEDCPRLVIERLPAPAPPVKPDKVLAQTGLLAMLNKGRGRADGYQKFRSGTNAALAYELKVWRAPAPELLTEHLGEYTGSELPVGAHIWLFEDRRTKAVR